VPAELLIRYQTRLYIRPCGGDAISWPSMYTLSRASKGRGLDGLEAVAPPDRNPAVFSRIHVAGDTEHVPDMKRLQDIDIAFLPMNLPYTMTPEMVAEAAKAFRPKILYPYHYGNTDTSELVKLLEVATGIEVRIREMS